MNALDQAFAPDAPLGVWREMIEQLYRIELPLEPWGRVRLIPESEGGRQPDLLHASDQTAP